MSGSKNRKNVKTGGENYNTLKATDAANWATKINVVSAISFIIKTFDSLGDVLNAINAYFEILKYAFPKVIVKRRPNVDKSLVQDAGSLNDDLELKTLKDKDAGETVKWLKNVKTMFGMLEKTCDLEQSNPNINLELLKSRCKQFEALMKISPVYIGHKPLFKYTNVREAFKKLGQNVAALPIVVGNAIDNLSKQAK